MSSRVLLKGKSYDISEQTTKNQVDLPNSKRLARGHGNAEINDIANQILKTPRHTILEERKKKTCKISLVFSTYLILQYPHRTITHGIVETLASHHQK